VQGRDLTTVILTFWLRFLPETYTNEVKKICLCLGWGICEGYCLSSGGNRDLMGITNLKKKKNLTHPPSLKLGFPLTDSGAAHHVCNLSTILVASIQDAKDRIGQIEYVFCSQFYPQLKSEAASKRRRTDQLQREVDENMAPHKNLMELVQSKVSALRNAEEKRNIAFSKLEDCEREKVKLLARIKELDEKLRRKTREVEEEGARKTCFCNETCVRKWKREKMLLLTRRRRTMARFLFNPKKTYCLGWF